MSSDNSKRIDFWNSIKNLRESKSFADESKFVGYALNWLGVFRIYGILPIYRTHDKEVTLRWPSLLIFVGLTVYIVTSVGTWLSFKIFYEEIASNGILDVSVYIFFYEISLAPLYCYLTSLFLFFKSKEIFKIMEIWKMTEDISRSNAKGTDKKYKRINWFFLCLMAVVVIGYTSSYIAYLNESDYYKGLLNQQPFWLLVIMVLVHVHWNMKMNITVWMAVLSSHCLKVLLESFNDDLEKLFSSDDQFGNRRKKLLERKELHFEIYHLVELMNSNFGMLAGVNFLHCLIQFFVFAFCLTDKQYKPARILFTFAVIICFLFVTLLCEGGQKVVNEVSTTTLITLSLTKP